MANYHLGINLGHDRAAALVNDGEIVVAIHQERLDRRKYSVGFLLQSAGDNSLVQLPDEAIQYCLDYCDITLNDLDTITANMPGVDHAPQILRAKLPKELSNRVLQVPSHHLAHAYSTYWPSGFEDALVLVCDATGNTGSDRLTESYTLYEAHGPDLKVLYDHKVPAHLASLSTLGFIYEYISRKAGFSTDIGSGLSIAESGKLMGLASYGGVQTQWNRWLNIQENSYDIGISAYDIFLEVAALEKKYDTKEGQAHMQPYLVDLAWKVQNEVEQVLKHIVGLAVQKTGIKNLCMAGGVALNSVANYKLLTDLNLDDIFIFPAAGDAGNAAGCAFWAYASQNNGTSRRHALTQATLGKTYDKNNIKNAISNFEDQINFEELSDDETINRFAKSLSKGNIVANFKDRAEYGPRALGNRSIIADPAFKKMKDIINARVKFREAFRPFAPVIPEENISEVFDQNISSPYMLMVSPIKPKYQDIIPAVTHFDGTGRVQTVGSLDNPFLYDLCYKVASIRDGAPVLLNTSFNVGGQPIVETPQEAIETFLRTDIDYLCLENFWISKKGVQVCNYEDHLQDLPESIFPQGLKSDQPPLTDLMKQLDQALFQGITDGCAWTPEELAVLSAKGARFKETSNLFPQNPFNGSFKTQLSPSVTLLLDPLGKSKLVNLNGSGPLHMDFCFSDVCIIMTLLHGNPEQLEELRTQEQYLYTKWQKKIEKIIKKISQYGLKPCFKIDFKTEKSNVSIKDINKQVLSSFNDPKFQTYDILSELTANLKKYNYTEAAICDLLKIKSLQLVEPTHLNYYDQFSLPQDKLGDLIRLFFLRVPIQKIRIHQVIGFASFNVLVRLGILVPADDMWVSRIQLFWVDGLYIATDPRFINLPNEKPSESPVMYIGLDSKGLVNAAPRTSCKKVLDLCTGSGVQALVASRYAQKVIGIDLNDRAIRFARFNAQLNGIKNVKFLKGDLFAPVDGQTFDVILANPPFVPSPESSLKFRDGGLKGEDILKRIVQESVSAMTPEGKLHIVTDLVDVDTYEEKLKHWWPGAPAHMLVLHTADRDDMQFSVPHCHSPFSQSIEDYNKELGKWINNFHGANISSVNFGYIFIHRKNKPDTYNYYNRIISNPDTHIYSQVQKFFEQLEHLNHPDRENFYLQLEAGCSFRIETNLNNSRRRVELFWKNNPYYTTYVINDNILRRIKQIAYSKPQYKNVAKKQNEQWVCDLILKGILMLQPMANLTGKVLDRRKGDRSEDKGFKVVKEISTETTPTCLSSYL